MSFAGLADISGESWKYTRLDLLQSRDAALADAPVDAPAPLVDGAYRMVFVGGAFDRAQSGALPAGVRQGCLPDTLAGDAAVAALNQQDATDGARVMIAAGTLLDRPLELVFCGSGGIAHNQIWIELGDNAEATIIEDHDYHGGCTATSLTRILLADGARLKHYRLHSAGPEAVSLATGSVSLGRDATYEAFSLTLGGRLTRHQVTAELAAPGGHLELNGAHVLDGSSHADTTTEIRHAAPHCASRETYRHVMDGNARSVFQGKIHVARAAQKTDGFQLNQSLMLSPGAEVDAKPELEIYADDVKCSHGATSGRLDEDALFYLRSRGLPLGEARALLVDAFIGSAIDLIADETVREAFRAVAAAALHREAAHAE